MSVAFILSVSVETQQHWLNSGPSLLLMCTGVCKSLATWGTGPPVGVAEEGDGQAAAHSCVTAVTRRGAGSDPLSSGVSLK